MDSKKLEKALKDYTDLSTEIRVLSSPLIESIASEDEYRAVLTENFMKVGDIATTINKLLDETLYPVLADKKPLSEEQVEILTSFTKSHVDTTTMKTLDPMICYMIADRLVRDAEAKGDDDKLIIALDLLIDSAYSLMRIGLRLTPRSDLGYTYRDYGIAAGRRIMGFLDKELFVKINDNSKELVLSNARFISALLFWNGVQSSQENHHDIELLKDALALAEDEFYLKEAPNYDWRRHTFRTLQYISSYTERLNMRGLSSELLEEIYGYATQLDELWKKDEAYCSTLCARKSIDMGLARVSYLTGRLTIEEYKEELRKIINLTDKNSYDFYDSNALLFAFDEYLLAVWRSEKTAEDMEFLRRRYTELPRYLHRMPKHGSFSYATTTMSLIIKDYVDVPDFKFSEFCMKLIAAVHPPTYIHSLTVSALVRTMTYHMIRKEPARFTSFPGCRTPRDVIYHENAILEQAENAALCHDIGKLFLLEIVMMYGRKLRDEEFDLMYTHADIGAYALRSHDETEPYSPIAFSHHFYFRELDNQFVNTMFGIQNRPLIDIACVADGMDAATDIVGRSYKTGKTFEEFKVEVDAGRGSRYAPYVVDLFADPEIQEDFKKILSEGREENYKKTYEVLIELDKE